MPMKNKDGVIIGVFQLLNKKGGPFGKEDEQFIDALSSHASVAIENARLAQEMVKSERLSADQSRSFRRSSSILPTWQRASMRPGS